MPEALIWGASGGIGGALVTALKSANWRVFAAARDQARIPAGADVRLPFDAAAESSIAEAALVIAHETSGLDLMVYAAGELEAEKLLDLSTAGWQSTLDANLTGAYLAARSSLNLMREGGHMVFIGAYVEQILLPKLGAYAAAKAALVPFVTILAKENRKRKFTLVRPPAVNTPFWQHLPFSLPDDKKLSPEQVAAAILAHVQSGASGELNL